MKLPTYKAARAAVLIELAKLGWDVKPNLKTPTARKGDAILFFRPQAIYGTHKDHPRASHSIPGLDVRTATAAQIETRAMEHAAWTNRHEADKAGPF